MQLGELYFVRGKKWRYAHYFNDPELCRQGTFSAVALLSKKWVAKATCCKATQSKFNLLLQLDHPVSGLPVVARKLRVVARSDDTSAGDYLVYLVQRLHPITDQPQHRRAAALRDALLAEVRGKPYSLDPDYDHKLALRLARKFPPLAEAFTFLARFIRDTGYVLDDIHERQLMVDRLGNLVLADPVADNGDGPPILSCEEAQQLGRGFD